MDLTHKRFGRLEVIRSTDERKGGSVVWECKCDCGNMIKVPAKSLVNENTKSCGCLLEETRGGQVKHFQQMAVVDSVAGTRLSHLNNTRFKHNTSGIRGVFWCKAAGKWMATITFRKKMYYLGIYNDKRKAELARKIAEDELWKPFLEEQLGEFKDEKELKEKVDRFLKEKIKEKIKAEQE